MNLKFKIQEYDKKELVDKYWDKYLKYAYTLYKNDDPERPLPPEKKILQLVTRERPIFNDRLWLIINNKTGDIFGYGRIQYYKESSQHYEKNKHLAYLNLGILPEWRDDGVKYYKAIAKQLVKESIKLEKNILDLRVQSESAKKYFESLNGQFIAKVVIYQVKLNKISWELMQEWLNKGKEQNPGIKLEAYGFWSKELAEEYAEFYSKIRDSSLDEVTGFKPTINKKSIIENERNSYNMGLKSYKVVARNEKNMMVGITSIQWYPNHPYTIFQSMTAVLPECREKGLAKHIKASLMFYIKENMNESKVIKTGNIETYDAIQGINKKIGFKKKEERYDFKFEVDKLADKFQL